MANKKSDEIVVSNVVTKLSNSSAVCRMCGTAYGKMNGYFYKSYAQLYKGVGYLPFCKRCVDYLYENYLAQSNSARDACRQVCRKLDLYWDEAAFNSVQKNHDARSVMVAYITRVNSNRYAGLSYDDTLEKANMLWDFVHEREAELKRLQEEKARQLDEKISSLEEEISNIENMEPEEPVPEEVKDMWGTGYTDSMYRELERRRKYWMDQLESEGVDVNKVGAQALLRQIVSTELDINRSRTAGEDVDKKVNTFKSLLSDAMLKPSQNKNEDSNIDNTPLGVWAWRYEHKRPIPEVDDDFKDVNGIRKYITIWMKGHLAKMVGLRNSYSQMYEDEIKRLSVEKIDYEDDASDDSFLVDLFADDGGDTS